MGECEFKNNPNFGAPERNSALKPAPLVFDIPAVYQAPAIQSDTLYSMRKLILGGLAVTAIFFAGYTSGSQAASKNHVYELRTYYAADGKLSDLNARFRNHTVKLFEKHGMKNVVYGVPMDAPASANTLIYLLQHDSREAAKKSWDAFRNDPDWNKARTASEVNGKLTTKVESVFLEPTDYSPMK